MAMRELDARTSDMVIIGGVDNSNGPFGFLSFSKTHALSNWRVPHLRCESRWHRDHEGLVMVVIKRLEDAERDGDRIYAVVRDSAHRAMEGRKD